MKTLVATLLVGLVAGTASAQTLDRTISRTLDARGHEKLVDGLTTGLVAFALLDGLDEQGRRDPTVRCGNFIERGFCNDGWRRRVVKDLVAIGVTVGTAEATKRLVSRDRPDGSDAKSFFSEHTALASLPIGWLPRAKIPIVLTISVGVGRVSAQKHYPSDVLVGSAVGQVVGFLTR